MKQFTSVSEIRKLKKQDMLETIASFSKEEKEEFKQYLLEKTNGTMKGNSMYLYSQHFIISKQFPSIPKDKNHNFANDLMLLLEED